VGSALWRRNVKLDEIRKACAKASVTHMRRPAKDFDKGSLRKAIPGAVAQLAHAMSSGGRCARGLC
jgi:hypothetical protein